MYRYSMTQWIVGNEDIEASFARLQNCGYDGIELAAEPYTTDTSLIIELMKKYRLECTSLCGMFSNERNLSSNDPEISKNALVYLKDSIDFARKLGAKQIIVVPSPVGMVSPADDCGTERLWENAVNTLRKAGTYASDRGVGLVIEAINRYETFFVNTLEKALKLAMDVDCESVGVMADVFHMSLEERDMAQSLHKIAKLLRHVHIADNTREAAGLGSTDFKRILRTLEEIRYGGVLAMEFLPRISNPYQAAGAGTKARLMDYYAKQSIDYMKMMEASVRQGNQ